MQQRVREEKATILDFLPNGYPFDKRPMHMKTPIAQAMGQEFFLVMELVPKKGIFLQPLEEVYIGEGKRDKIHHIIGKIGYERLTQTAKLNMEQLVAEFVQKHEKRFVEFFNTAGPINARRHQIELIPGIGKKHMWEILEERKNRLFESFMDIKSRVKLMPDPEKSLVKRIFMELKEEDKHKLFVGS